MKLPPLKILFLIAFFGIFFSSCEEKPRGTLEFINHTVNIPLSISPTQKTYKLGDTIFITLIIENFYSEDTKKQYPIRPGDKIEYPLRIIDLEKRREGVSTGEYGLRDFEVIAEREETDFGGISIFTANYDFEMDVLSSQVKLIPTEASTYMLKILRLRGNFSQKIDWEPDCEETASFYSKINNSPAERNIDIVADDTSLVENIYGLDFYEYSYDFLLNREYQYFFVVEE
jgi:hypothetical protein